MIFKLTALLCLLAVASGQAPVLPSYYQRQPYYPTSLYGPSAYPQSSSVNSALAYQQEQQLQRERALSAYQQAYQQSAAAATLPGRPGQPPSYLDGGRPAFTSNPSVNYSPQQLPAVNYQPQSLAAQQQPPPQSAIQYAQPQYQQPSPQTSYNPQGLQTISYQPQNEQPVAPPTTSYDPQPQYNPEEIAGNSRKSMRNLRSEFNTNPLKFQFNAALQRQRDAELSIQRQRQQELAIQRQRDGELALQKQREAEQLAGKFRKRSK